MHLVDWNTFVSLPSGTIFSKQHDYEVCVKHRNIKIGGIVSDYTFAPLRPYQSNLGLPSVDTYASSWVFGETLEGLTDYNTQFLIFDSDSLEYMRNLLEYALETYTI